MAQAAPALAVGTEDAASEGLSQSGFGPLFHAWPDVPRERTEHSARRLPPALLGVSVQPLTLGLAAGVALIPVDGSTLGIIPIGLVTVGISYNLCRLFLYLPLFAAKEHEALSAGFGPPIVATGFHVLSD